MNPEPAFEPQRSSEFLFSKCPAHWKIQRLKWSVTGVFNGIWGNDPTGIDDITCVRVADFDRLTNSVIKNPPTSRSVDSKFLENRKLKAGDLLIEKSGGGDKQLVGCVVSFDHDFDAVCSNFVARMQIAERMYSRFWAYCHAALYAARLNFPAIKQTTGIQNIDAETYLDIKVAFPPLSEQKAIANYLDQETAQIDSLISEKEQMLVLLEEKRAALISQAVIRGLNSDVEFVFSGLDWLGEIPKHWKLRRAKGLFGEIDQRTKTGEETLLSLRMKKGLVPHHDVSDKPLEPKDVIGFKQVKKEQMVINRMRAASGLIAVSPQDGLVSPDYAVFDIIDQRISIDYYLELFKTQLLQAKFRSASKGIGTGSQGFLRLYSESFLALHFPYPPINEQYEIVAFINKERLEIQEAEALLVSSIELLRERRAALITAAITGKIDIEEMTA